jgi:hypothetical protein
MGRFTFMRSSPLEHSTFPPCRLLTGWIAAVFAVSLRSLRSPGEKNTTFVQREHHYGHHREGSRQERYQKR